MAAAETGAGSEDDSGATLRQIPEGWIIDQGARRRANNPDITRRSNKLDEVIARTSNNW